MMIFVLSCCDCLCVTIFDKFDKFDNLDILDNFGVCPRIDFGDPLLKILQNTPGYESLCLRINGTDWG